MSQSRIRRTPETADWMRELEVNAQNWQAVMQAIDKQSALAIADLARKDIMGCALRMAEVREGIKLACELAGVKLQPYVTNT